MQAFTENGYLLKLIIVLYFVLTIKITGFSQTKILFDASKAETAGNADWVIDADNWNLGYYPNAGLGGDESNAQNIPTPAQAGINSGTSQNYWNGGISAWGVDAVIYGFQVATLPYDGQISYGNSSNLQDLSNYDIFVVCEPNILFTPSEKSAIITFVQNGGGLFMVSDHDNSDRNGDGYDSPAIWNDLMQNNSVQNNPFGLSFDYEFFTEATSNIPVLPGDPLLHGTYGNVTSVEFYGGTSITLNPSQNSSVKGVVYRTGYPNTGNAGVLCAYASFGNGKVIALGDSSPADDGTGDSGDDLYDGWIQDANGNHERLIMNATLWLASSSTGIETVYQYDVKVKISTSKQICNFTIDSQLKYNTYKIEFFDLFGRPVLSKNNLMPEKQYKVQLKAHNIYFYRLSTDAQTVKTGKVLL